MPNKLFKEYLGKLLHSNYAVSAAFHLILIGILAMIMIKAPQAPVWHTFEWEQIFPTVPANAGDMSSTEANGENDQISNEEKSEGSLTSNPQPSTNESEILELPKVSSISRPVSQAALAENKGSKDYLNQYSYGNNGEDGSGSGFASSFNGGDVSVRERMIPKVEVKDFGTVTMEFTLLSNGKVNPESVEVKAFTATEYVNPSTEALKKWRFNINGRFNSSKVYKVNFVFTPQ